MPLTSVVSIIMKLYMPPFISWKSALLIFALSYAAFQAHVLPNAVARIVGRVAFYPTWPLTWLARRRDYWSEVDPHVLLGAAPMSFMHHVDSLYARGVRAVVNLCDEYHGPRSQYRAKRMTQLYLPTIEHLAKDHGVYVHCKGGNGRSAAIVFCWLLATHPQWTLEQTQQYLNTKRRVRKSLSISSSASTSSTAIHSTSA